MKNKLEVLGALLVFFCGFCGQDISAVSSAELDKLVAQTDYELRFSDTDAKAIVQAFGGLVSVEQVVDHKPDGKCIISRLVINLEDSGSMNAFNRKCAEIGANLNDPQYAGFFTAIENIGLGIKGFKEAIKRDTLHLHFIAKAAAMKSANLLGSYMNGADQEELDRIRKMP